MSDRTGLRHVLVRRWWRIVPSITSSAGCRRRRPAGGLIYTDRSGAAFETYPSRSRLPGLRPPGSRPFFRRRTRGVQRPRVRRLAPHGCERCVRDRLLHRRRTFPSSGRRRRTGPCPAAISRRSWRPTYPNRNYQHAGVTDRLDDSTTLSTLETIWDRLADKGLEGRYYSRISRSWLCGERSTTVISRPYAEFLADCASGNLPEVAFVDPPFAGEEQVRLPRTITRTATSVPASRGFTRLTRRSRPEPTGSTPSSSSTSTSGEASSSTYPPPHPTSIPSSSFAASRVPCIVVSPSSGRGGVVRPDVRPHLDLPARRIAVEVHRPLSVRDAAADSLAEALDLDDPDLDAPDYAVPPFASPRCR